MNGIDHQPRAALILGACAVLLFAAIPASAQTPPSAPPAVNLHLDNVSFSQALDAVFQGSGLTYCIAPSVLAANAGSRISFGTSGTKFEEALRAVLRTADRPLRYTTQDGVVQIEPIPLAPDGLPTYGVTVDADGGTAQQALESMAGRTTLQITTEAMDYPVTLHLHGVPFDQALRSLVSQSPRPLKYKLDATRLLVASTEPKVPVPVNNPVTLHLTDTPASEALTALLQAGHIGNYVLNGPHLQGRVTLQADGVPFETALQSLLRQSDPHAVYEWTTALDYFGNTDLHIYDVPASLPKEEHS